MTKSFLSKNLNLKGYTMTLSLSEVHIFIHMSIRKPKQKPQTGSNFKYHQNALLNTSWEINSTTESLLTPNKK